MHTQYSIKQLIFSETSAASSRETQVPAATGKGSPLGPAGPTQLCCGWNRLGQKWHHPLVAAASALPNVLLLPYGKARSLGQKQSPAWE